MSLTINLPGDGHTAGTPDHWYPKSHPGYFYILDRQYYLYGRKGCCTLRDVTHKVFQLPFLPQHGSTQVWLGGLSHSNFDVRGDELWVKLDRLEDYLYGNPPVEEEWWNNPGYLYGPNCSVRAQFLYDTWYGTGLYVEPTGNLFVTATGEALFYLRDGRTVYQFTEPGYGGSGLIPDPPAGAAPIVLTDDSIEDTDERTHTMEFRVDPEDGVIEFNTNENLLLNSSFEADTDGDSIPPIWFWVTPSGSVNLHTSGGWHGENYVTFQAGGQVYQPVEIDPRKPYVGSAVFRGSGVGVIRVDFLTASGVLLGSAIEHVNPDSSTEWQRGYLYMGNPDWESDQSWTPIPSGTEVGKFQLFGAGMDADAAKLETDWEATDFDPLSPLITIEYETDDSVPYDPGEDFENRFGTWPSGVPDIEDDLPQVNNVNTRECYGYYLAEEFTTQDDRNFGNGGWASGVVPTITGLPNTEIGGSRYLAYGRRSVPYARTSGHTKFRLRNTFHRPNPARMYDVSRYTDIGIPAATDLQLGPMPDTVIENDGSVTLTVIPATGYQRDLEFFLYDQRGLPAYHHWVTANPASGTITPTGDYTDESGGVRFVYTPPPVMRTGRIDQIVATGSSAQTVNIDGYINSLLEYSDFFAGTAESTPEVFSSHATMRDSLLHYWKLNNFAASTIVTDEFLGGPGTLINNTCNNVSTTTAKQGRAFHLNGTDEYVDVGYVESVAGSIFEVGKDWSVSLWVRLDAVGKNHGLFGNIGLPLPYQRGFMIYVGSADNKVAAMLSDNGYRVSYHNTALLAATWYHVVVCYDGAVAGGLYPCAIYLNDVEDRQYPGVQPGAVATIANSDLYIGGGSSPGETNLPMDGIIDCVGVWNRVLTAAEVQYLYNGGAGTEL